MTTFRPSSAKPFFLGFGFAISLVVGWWMYNQLGVRGGSGSHSPSGSYTLSLDQLLDDERVLHFELRNNTTKKVTRRGTIQIFESPFIALARGSTFNWGPNEEFVEIFGTNGQLILRLSTLDLENQFTQLSRSGSGRESQ